ncbi:late control protein D [Salmonella enterica subsp. enterica serovar Saintpaul]|nr:late control protein D [Salmonella enterica subsp. enterica serovar Saintpaul]
MQTVKPWLPAFSLTANDKDITKEVSRTLESLTYIDYGATDDEPKSDTLTFSLVSPSMPLPKKGAILRLALGFDTQLQDKGVFVVSEVSLQSGSGGKKMTVTALATPMDNSKGTALMQTRKTRSWDDVTLGDIVKTIAQENNLSPRISVSLADITPGHQDQTAENDVEFLARLARGFMTVTKIAGGCCIFAEQGDNTAVSGAKLPEVTLTPDGHTQWQFAHRSKRKRKSHSVGGGRHQKIIVQYIDACSGETRSVISPGKEPAYKPGYVFSSKAEAEERISSWQKVWARQDAVAASQKKKAKNRARNILCR